MYTEVKDTTKRRLRPPEGLKPHGQTSKRTATMTISPWSPSFWASPMHSGLPPLAARIFEKYRHPLQLLAGFDPVLLFSLWAPNPEPLVVGVPEEGLEASALANFTSQLLASEVDAGSASSKLRALAGCISLATYTTVIFVVCVSDGALVLSPAFSCSCINMWGSGQAKIPGRKSEICRRQGKRINPSNTCIRLLFSSRLELETFRVLGECDNQLHHENGSIWWLSNFAIYYNIFKILEA